MTCALAIRPSILLLVATLAPAAALAPRRAIQEGASTTGYARTANVLERGELPTPEQVVVADFVNWRRHQLPPPKAGEPVALDARFDEEAARCGDEVVLQVGLATARQLGVATLPPLDVVVVVDCSGSMDEPGKMPRVHAGLERLVAALRADDRLAIVAYDDAAWIVRPLASLDDRRCACATIRELKPRGRTNLHDGLMLGYRVAAEGEAWRCDDAERSDDRRDRDRRASPGARVRRVLLLTDGIANVGVTDPATIVSDSQRYGDAGIDLATIGVGNDLNDDLLKQLARGGRGLYHFVASGEDLEKVFVDDLQSLLAPVARRARLEVELDDGLELERVLGGDARFTPRGFEVELDDLNAGLTQVLLAQLRVSASERWPDRSNALRARARLTFEQATTERSGSCDAKAGLAFSSGRATPILDPEVTRNWTIALLADALHQAAVDVRGEAGSRRARRDLESALAFADARFARRDDEDVERVARLAREALKLIARARERDCDEGRR